MPYKRGAIIIQKPPSVLHQFLGGLGFGITQGVEKQTRQAEERRAKAANVLESIIAGDLDSRLLATEEGKGWLRKKGIWDDPDVQQAVFEGQLKAGLLGEGGMGPPAPFKLSAARETIQEEADRIVRRNKRQEIEDSLFVFEEKERIKKELDKPRPLHERLRKAIEGYNYAIKNNIPVEDIVVTDPDSGIKIDLFTHIENLQNKQIESTAKSKEGIKYLNELKSYYDLQINTAKFFHNLVMGKTEPDSELTGEFRTMLNEIMESLGRKQLSTQDIKTQVQRLLPLLNKKLKIQHQILFKQKKIADDPTIRLPFLKQFNIKEVLEETARFGAEFEVIERYSNSIGNITQGIDRQKDIEAGEETPAQPVKESQARNIVVVPPEKPKPTPQQIEAKAQEILAAAAGLVGPNGETMTIEIARRLAREALGVKEEPGKK